MFKQPRSGGMRRRAALLLVCSIGLGAVFGPSLPAAAQGYPNRPVRIIVPYGPGGVADVTMRLIAQKLGERLGQQFIIDNRPGAGGILAAKSTIRSEEHTSELQSLAY